MVAKQRIEMAARWAFELWLDLWEFIGKSVAFAATRPCLRGIIAIIADSCRVTTNGVDKTIATTYFY